MKDTSFAQATRLHVPSGMVDVIILTDGAQTVMLDLLATVRLEPLPIEGPVAPKAGNPLVDWISVGG